MTNLRILTGLLLFGAWGFCHAADAAPAKALEEILGSSGEWQVAPYQGTTDNYTLTEKDEKPVLIAGANAVVLMSSAGIKPDTEVTVKIRLGADEAKTTICSLVAGLKVPTDTNQNTSFLSLSAAAGTDQVQWAMPQIPNKVAEGFLPYTVRNLPKNRLAWPEMVRARVEQDYASAVPLAQRWLTLRYVIRQNSARVYLDGRLLRTLSGMDPTGYVRITLFDGAQLASVRMRPLPPENPRFEEVELGYDLNASAIKGDRIKRDSLPEAGKSTEIGGVPFLFPAPDARGNDHIDVGRSWVRFGALEGEFDGLEGDMATWNSPMTVESGRIAFRVRNAAYNKLYLIAAFDGEPDKVPVVTAQFYRESAGHPVGFSAKVPLFEAKSSEVQALPVQLASGKKGNLYLITIPLEPEGLASLSDRDTVDVELTKEASIYRSYPDPSYYSRHGAGLPSGVQVYAMTLARPAVEVDFQPDKYAHIWTAPDEPSYAIRLKNNTTKEQGAEIKLLTKSYDGLEKVDQQKSVRIPASSEKTVKLPLELNRYGYHSVELQVRGEDGLQTQTRSLAYLHPDTREQKVWEEGKGPLWGFWDWDGGHVTPMGIPRLEVAVELGIRSSMLPLLLKTVCPYSPYTPEEIAFAEQHGMVSPYLAYQFTPTLKEHLGVAFDAAKPAEMEAAVAPALKKLGLGTPTPTNKPDAAVFFGEPMLGTVSVMSFPEYYGDPPYQMTPEEQASYKTYLDEFVIAARAIKKEWPNAKCYMPWGIASFPIPFLRNSKEFTALFDGPAVDCILFERLPEMQMGQVTFASMFWQLKQEWIKAGKPWPPQLLTVEGGGLSTPAVPGGLTEEEEAEHSIRGELMLSVFGVTRHLGWPSLFACGGSWGETQYGGGLCEPLPLLSPKIYLSAYATMTRQLDGMNYVKTVETGSASVFGLQFKHYKTGKLLDIFWTVRGKRPMTVEAGDSVTVYDSMDNETKVEPQGGKVTLPISTAPCYVWGLQDNPKIMLGEPDHSDSKPAELAVKLGNLGDGKWKLSAEHDADYENVGPEFTKKFPGTMSIQTVSAPAAAGDKALAVHLGKQEKDRGTMPFYTTLMPGKPILIPGQASHLGLWVRAASDWGRVVYSLRDAKGQKWLSVGNKGTWNQDDPNCWSQFCFDGWRYLTFELPGNQPWDAYRNMGSTWWGYYGKGDGMVALPLTLEKIIVERRAHVIKADELIPANPEDVLLGNLYAEYEKASDKSEEVIRLSRLRMPLDKNGPALENPIQKLTGSGVGAPTAITKVVPPEYGYDGTQCQVSFTPVAEARSYDIWASNYADGRDAIRLETGWTEPGKLLTGLPANAELYLFVTYTDKDGKTSKPSAAKRILLKDDFPFK